MEIVKETLRKVLVTVLFSAAFFSTFFTISNVSAGELSSWAGKQSVFSISDWIRFNTSKQQVTEGSNSIEEGNRVVGGWLNGNVIQGENEFAKKDIGFQFKRLPIIHKEDFSLSHPVVELDTLSIDDVVDWSQYPSNTVVATGYTAGYESTGKSPGHPSYGITFSGVEVRRDLYSTIAADPNYYPIGSILYIPGYGYGVVADTGSAIKGHKIDLYYETIEDVFNNWGKQEVEVYVVKKGEGKLTEEELNQLNENEAVQVFRRQIAF